MKDEGIRQLLAERKQEVWEIIKLPVETEDAFPEMILAEIDHLLEKPTVSTALDTLNHDTADDSFNSVLDWAAEIRTRTLLPWPVCIELAGIYYYG